MLIAEGLTLLSSHKSGLFKTIKQPEGRDIIVNMDSEKDFFYILTIFLLGVILVKGLGKW